MIKNTRFFLFQKKKKVLAHANVAATMLDG